MNNFVALLDTPSITEFLDEPIQSLTAVLTSDFGIIGYILILFSLCAITYSITKNWESVGIFIILFGAAASVLFPIEIGFIMLVLGVGVIFGSVFWKALFKTRGEY